MVTLLAAPGVASAAVDPPPPVHGPEAEMSISAGSRPVSGDAPEAGLPFTRGAGQWEVNTITPTLRNTVTDADGDRSNLTFEVWTVDANGNPDTKVKLTDANPYGVEVSPYVDSGEKASVTIEAGRLENNTTYLFHTNAYDGSLYETSWSAWGQFRIRAGIDLALPARNASSPNPNQGIQPVSYTSTPPLKVDDTAPSALTAEPGQADERGSGEAEEQCGPVNDDGGQVCWGKPIRQLTPDKGEGGDSSLPTRAAEASGGAAGYADWCDDDLTLARATRTIACENRKVPAYYRLDGDVQATAYFLFQRLLVLDGVNSFTEHFTVKPISIPADFARIQLGIYRHLCKDGCDPVEADPAAWKGKPDWTAGDTHVAWIASGYTWDNSTPDEKYTFTPDVQINGIIDPVGEETIQTMGYQWSLGGTSGFDTIRCDTMTGYTTAGCVFPNYAPTYTFNAAKHPQAAAHAWLIQQALPNHPGSKVDNKPLYYLPGGRNGDNREVICDVTGWAKMHYDSKAMNTSSDAPNCDEFAFNATYNSGGMPGGKQGGLNPVNSGSECVQSYSTKVDNTIHLRNLPGSYTSFNEVCGRSAISGSQNSGSMSAFSSGFAKKMRLMDKDAYWLDTGLAGDCSVADMDAWRCTMTVTQ